MYFFLKLNLYCPAYLSHANNAELESFAEMPVHDGRKDFGQVGIIKGLYSDHVHVSHEPQIDVVSSASPGRTHRSHQQLQKKKNVIDLKRFLNFCQLQKKKKYIYTVSIISSLDVSLRSNQ